MIGLGNILSVVGGVLWKIAKITIPIPVGILAFAVIAFQASAHWDKTKAVHEAVKSRVTELVTGAEKASLEAQLEATKHRLEQERKISEALQRQQYAYAKAEERFNTILTDREKERANLQRRINALAEKYVRDGSKADCNLTPELFGFGVRDSGTASGN